MTSIPVEMSSSWWFSIERSSLLPLLSHSCTNNCGQQGYPYGLRLTALGTSRNGANDPSGDSMSFVSDNTVIGAGIKIDTNGLSQVEGGLKISNTTIEQPINSAVMIDPRYTGTILPITLDNLYLQDNFMSYTPSWVGFTDEGQGTGEADIQG